MFQYMKKELLPMTHYHKRSKEMALIIMKLRWYNKYKKHGYTIKKDNKLYIEPTRI